MRDATVMTARRFGAGSRVLRRASAVIAVLMLVAGCATTGAQIEALVPLLHRIVDDYDIPRANVVGH